MGHEEKKKNLKTTLLFGNQFQPIGKKLVATYFFACLGHGMRNITFFYHTSVTEVF